MKRPPAQRRRSFLEYQLSLFSESLLVIIIFIRAFFIRSDPGRSIVIRKKIVTVDGIRIKIVIGRHHLVDRQTRNNIIAHIANSCYVTP